MIGIMRDRFKSNKAYVFHGVERMARDYSEQRSGTILDMCLKVKKFLKRTDFSHRVPVDAIEKKDDFAFLDPKGFGRSSMQWALGNNQILQSSHCFRRAVYPSCL